MNLQTNYDKMMINNNWKKTQGPKSNFIIYKHLVYKSLLDLITMRNQCVSFL